MRRRFFVRCSWVHFAVWRVGAGVDIPDDISGIGAIFFMEAALVLRLFKHKEKFKGYLGRT